MPLNVTVVVNDLWHLTGVRPHPPERRPLSEWTGVPRHLAPPKYLVLIEWDAAADYLAVAAAVADPRKDFSANPAEARALFAAYGWDDARLPECLKSPLPRFLVAEVSAPPDPRQPEPRLELNVAVDTDRRSFRALAPAAPNGATSAELTVTSYFPPAGGAAPRVNELKKVLLQFMSAREMDPYNGYVALDLGNTNSSLAYLSRDHVDPKLIYTVSSRAVGADPSARRGTEDTTPSAVRVLSIAAAPHPAKAGGEVPYQQADYLIGWDAQAGAENLILGAKRLLAAPPGGADDRGYQVWVDGEPRDIPRHLPAELFITGMLRRFHADLQRKVARLAVTCPTTFTEREIEQLKEVVLRAYGRAVGKANVPTAEQMRKMMPKLIPVVIDEASAAAFFFLYSDFILTLVGPQGLRYQYPSGLNLLLYDCGGGTTDIALVQVRAATAEETQSGKAFSHLYIDVLGRTGMRGFGGDNITQAAFRLLKAKLAFAAARDRVPPLPDRAAEWQAYLDDPATQDATDQVIPTRFRRPDDPDKYIPGLSQADIAERMALHVDLWRLAELFKKALSGPDRADEATVEVPQGSPLHQTFARVAGYDEEEAYQKLRKLAVRRDELDALIRDDVQASIDKANHLIESKLGDGEVHRAYVVGNASRYPLLQEMLRAGLRVGVTDGADGSAEEMAGRLKFDTTNLKNAVAKGAVVALRLAERQEGLYVGYDEELIKRMPYDIGYRDLARGAACLPVYHEHQKYKDLKPVLVPVPRPTSGTRAPSEFSLLRRWPGEGEWEPFVEFTFKEPFDGPLELKYDSHTQRFTLTDKGKSRQEVVGAEKSLSTYVSPAQQGKY